MARKSTGVYPENWDEIATQVKDEANWKWFRCAHGNDPKSGYTLTVHHLDLNPANCAWWNNLAKSYLSFLTLMVRSAPSICSNSSISLHVFFS